jgi:hypothetical protein
MQDFQHGWIFSSVGLQRLESGFAVDARHSRPRIGAAERPSDRLRLSLEGGPVPRPDRVISRRRDEAGLDVLANRTRRNLGRQRIETKHGFLGPWAALAGGLDIWYWRANGVGARSSIEVGPIGRRYSLIVRSEMY